MMRRGGSTGGAVARAEGFADKVGFIWSVADLLRGDYKAHEYGQVILPLTVLRRLDCVLEPTKAAVIARADDLDGQDRERRARSCCGPPGSRSTTPARSTSPGCSTTPRTSPRTSAPTSRGFSTGAAEVLDKYGFDEPDHPPRQRRAAVPGRRQVRRHRPAPGRWSRTTRWATSSRNCSASSPR